VSDDHDDYDALAAAAADLPPDASPWGDSHFQRHYSWPATSDHCAVDAGDRVLLAGCGRGDHVQQFLDAGASVVGVDASERALAAARDRFGDRATFHHVDLADGVGPPADDACDLVVSHLVASHLPDLGPFFAGVARTLRPDGRFVCTTIHPAYFRTEHGVPDRTARSAVTVDWPGASVAAYHRPLGDFVAAVDAAGLRLSALAEPLPRPAFEEHAPERYAAALASPQVCCLVATPR
jgi:SAM-dependent methyltransferase